METQIGQILGVLDSMSIRSFFHRLACWALALQWILLPWDQASSQGTSQQYFYDDASQLTRVIDGAGNVVTYNYDAAGNLLSVTTTTVDDLGPPVISSINPARWNAGNQFSVVVAGSNFFGGAVSVGHPDARVLAAFVNDENAFLSIELPEDATLGTSLLTVTTDEGADNIAFDVIGPLPMVVDVAPASGSALGGTEVLVRGRFFTEDTIVTLGGAPLIDPVFVDPGVIRGKTPMGDPNQLADLETSNPNGVALLEDAYRFVFPFSLPGATGVALGGSAPIQISLLEPALAEMIFQIFTLDTLRIGVPDTVTIPVGQTEGVLPVTGIRNGVGTLAVTLIDQFQLQSTVFVSGPLLGDFDITSCPIGMALGGPPATQTAVGAVIPGRTTFAPIVGGHVTRTSLPVARLNPQEVKNVVLHLDEPAPAGGVAVSLRSSAPGIVTTGAAPIVVAEGEQTVALPLTAGAQGRAFVVASFGDQQRQWEVLVGNVGLEQPLARAGIVGALVPSQDTATAEPVGALVAPREPTVAPAVGAEVEQNP